MTGFVLFWERFLITISGVLFVIVFDLQEPDQMNRLHLKPNIHCEVSLVVLINRWLIKIN